MYFARLALWQLILVLLLWQSSTNLSGQDQSQSDALIRRIGADTDALGRKIEQAAAKAATELEKRAQQKLQKLKAPKDVASTNAINNLLQQIRSSKTAEELEAAVRTAPIPLEAGMHSTIADFQDVLIKANQAYSAEYENIRERYSKEIRAAILQMKRQGNEFGARYLQDFYRKFLAIENPNYNRKCPELPADPAEAEIVWTRVKREWGAEFRALVLRQFREILCQIEPVHAQATIAGERAVIQQLEQLAQHLVSATDPDEVITWSKQKGKLLKPEVAVAITSLQNWCDQRKKQDQLLFDEIDAKWAQFTVKGLKERLRSELPLEQLRNQVSAHLRLTNTRVEWLSWPNKPLPKLDGKAEDIINEFDREALGLVANVTAPEQEARKKLITKLEENPFREEADQKLLDGVLELLKGPAAEGLACSWLIERQPKLSPADQAEVDSYLKDSQQLWPQLLKQHDQAFQAMRKKMADLQAEQLEKDDLIQFMLLEEYTAYRQFPPISVWIRKTRHEGSRFFASDFQQTEIGVLIAKKDDQYLVRSSPADRNPLWYKPEQVYFSWNDFRGTREQGVQSVSPFRPYEKGFNHPPSHAWDGTEILKPGAALIVGHDRDWKTETKFESYCTFGAVVNLPTFGNEPLRAMIPPQLIRVVD
jgi:hypothetical protein